MSHPQTIAVDFDGVIHAYSKGWHDGTIYDQPVLAALDSIHSLMRAGHAVFVHTTRQAYTVAQWLEERGVPAVVELESVGGQLREFWNDTTTVLVTNRKLPAIAYIDDRGIRFEDWAQALAELFQLEGIEGAP